MSGEKLKLLEQGPVTEPTPEKAIPAVPPKFITQVCISVWSQTNYLIHYNLSVTVYIDILNIFLYICTSLLIFCICNKWNLSLHLFQIESVGVGEAEPIHFECKVEPKSDPKLRIEWYRNGKLLPSGHRYRTIFDMGFVSLDILYVYPEDSGEYVCRAVNDYGEDFTKATISCKSKFTLIFKLFLKLFKT